MLQFSRPAAISDAEAASSISGSKFMPLGKLDLTERSPSQTHGHAALVPRCSPRSACPSGGSHGRHLHPQGPRRAPSVKNAMPCLRGPFGSRLVGRPQSKTRHASHVGLRDWDPVDMHDPLSHLATSVQQRQRSRLEAEVSSSLVCKGDDHQGVLASLYVKRSKLK